MGVLADEVLVGDFDKAILGNNVELRRAP